LEQVVNFVSGVLFETSTGPFIIVLSILYAVVLISEVIKNKRYGKLSSHVTIKGRYIYKGAGISIRLKSSGGWKTGIFLGADKNGFLIIKTESNAKIIVDPHFVTDVRVFDVNN